MGSKILNGLEHPNLEENLVSIPVDYINEEHASHTLGGQSLKEAYDSLKNKKTRANEKGAKWTRVDHMSNTHTTDTPKVSINVGIKRGLVEYGIETKDSNQLANKGSRTLVANCTVPIVTEPYSMAEVVDQPRRSQ